MIETWTVYDHPSDHPDVFVARRWDGDKPTTDHVTSPDLDAIRYALDKLGLVRIMRQPNDDPCIVETWL